MIPSASVLLLLSFSPQAGDDLSWNLPEGRAGVYEVFDAARHAKVREEIILACELRAGRNGNSPAELPWRYVFRPFPKRGDASWKVEEVPFGTHPRSPDAYSVRGTFTRDGPSTVRLGDQLRPAAGRPTDFPAVEGYRISSRLEVFHGETADGKFNRLQEAPVATITTWTLVRSSDGAVLGGRFQIKGTLVEWSRAQEQPHPAKVDESVEFLLRTPLLDLSAEDRNPAIAAAVDRGVQWLKGKAAGTDLTPADAAWKAPEEGRGVSFIVALALLRSGVLPTDPALAKILGQLDAKATRTYCLAAKLMAQEALQLPVDLPPSGTGAGEEKLRAGIAARMTPASLRSAADGVRLLLECQGRDGSFGYWKDEKTFNLSSTLFALMGLQSGARLGVPIPAAPWKRCFAALRASARASGAASTLDLGTVQGFKTPITARPVCWPYSFKSGDSSWDSSTNALAAVTALALIRSELTLLKDWSAEDERAALDLSRGALVWLDQHYNPRASRPEGVEWGPSMLYYYLYSVERAMVSFGLQRFGTHDWYQEGAALLLCWQKADGRWEGPQGTPILDTAFALLFLKRATVPVDAPPVATEGGK